MDFFSFFSSAGVYILGEELVEMRGAMRNVQFNCLVKRGLSNFQRLHRVCVERERESTRKEEDEGRKRGRRGGGGGKKGGCETGGGKKRGKREDL